ncbi:hypothetical protein BV25DRAFT_1819720 [Artomyces pyxidatus]|uniref:Uncharacterized protein n=1 Tax=Artomyces pyxidatus TaxID=48021 RepID=A0ACB8TG26_9AGAM|nr:hypothetical protein BV25DRAFT_1819720 [Artomyces pyxidatus]
MVFGCSAEYKASSCPLPYFEEMPTVAGFDMLRGPALYLISDLTVFSEDHRSWKLSLAMYVVYIFGSAVTHCIRYPHDLCGNELSLPGLHLARLYFPFSVTAGPCAVIYIFLLERIWASRPSFSIPHYPLHQRNNCLCQCADTLRF